MPLGNLTAEVNCSGVAYNYFVVAGCLLQKRSFQ